jgi:hypothetical protein
MDFSSVFRTHDFLEDAAVSYGFKKKGGVVECLNEGCGYTKKSARKGKKTDE